MQTNFNKLAREVKRIYKETDVVMKSVKKICGKGCSYCCTQNIRVSYGEVRSSKST